MKFFNFVYKNSLKNKVKSSKTKLYKKYYDLLKKKKNLININNNFDINEEFINSINISKLKCKVNYSTNSEYRKNYYIKNKKYKNKIHFNRTPQNVKDTKLYRYHMTKDKVENISNNIIKPKKKKKSLKLEWDYLNPCEK